MADDDALIAPTPPPALAGHQRFSEERQMSKLWYLIDEDFFFGTMRGTRAELDKLLAELPDLRVVSGSDYYFANDVLEQKYTLQ